MPEQQELSPELTTKERLDQKYAEIETTMQEGRNLSAKAWQQLNAMMDFDPNDHNAMKAAFKQQKARQEEYYATMEESRRQFEWAMLLMDEYKALLGTTKEDGISVEQPM